MASKSSVINVKINENNEVEYMDAEEDDGDTVDVIYYNDVEEFENDNDDEPIMVVPKSDGVMTIKMKEKTIIEHVCGKCAKSYKTIGGLKRHINLCKHLPRQDETCDDPGSVTNVSIDLMDLDEDKCICCLESKDTAHNGHIKCNFCPKSFKSHINLEHHLFTLHSASTDFPCSSCNATCPNQKVLELHEASHTEGKPFSCKTCAKEFTRKYHLDRHLQFTGCDKTRPKVALSCQVCNRVFTRIDNLREHLRGHMGQETRRRDYGCPHCEKRFYGSSLLNIHIRTHTGEKPFPCDLCDKSFPSNGALRKHRRSHTGERPYTCKECQKTFSAKETLNRHMNIHTGNRPHVCNICDKSFIQATQLRAHMFHHTGENGFDCKQCNRVFNRRGRLDNHIKQVHENMKSPKTKCTKCNLDFASNEDLLKHNETNHASKKTIPCQQCPKMFSSKTTLAFHLRVYHSKEICKCKVCKRTFHRLDLLMEHMRLKHKEELLTIISDDKPEPRKTRKKATKNVETSDEEEEEESYSLVENITYAEEDETNDKEKKPEKPASAETLTHYEITDNIEKESEPQKLIVQTNSDGNSLVVFTKVEPKEEALSKDELTAKIADLLNLLVDEQTLKGFGWPKASVEDVLTAVIEQCGQDAADYTTCPDYETKMRENTKLLFTSVIDNDAIKTLLNNQSVDEVIAHVLKCAA